MAESKPIAQQHKNVTEQISPDGTPIAPDNATQTPPQPAPQPTVVEEQHTEADRDAAHVAEQKDVTDENVDIMDFLAVSNRDTAKPEAKTEVKTDVVPAKTTPQKPVNARDYSDIAPEHTQAFERMSNEAFNLLKPVYLEHKQLKAKAAEVQAEIARRDEKIKQLSEGKQQVPDSYYEHENAFVLTPEFAETTRNINAYNTILNHWQSQLDAVRSGNAETYQTINVHPQTGEFYLSAPLPVDRTTEKQLQQFTQFAQSKLMESQAEINLMARLHKSKHNDAVSWARNFETAAFKNIEENPSLKAMAQDAVRRFPAAFQANPLAPALARALVTISQMGRLLQNQHAQPANGASTKTATTSAVRGNLTAAEIAGEGSGQKGDTSEVNFDDFKKAME